MRENLNRVNLIPGSGLNSHEIEINEQEGLTGGIEMKRKILGALEHRGRKKTVKLVKRFDNSGEYKKSWNVFRQAGIPIVPSLRVSKNNPDEIYLTDLTANGSEIYGKSVYFKILNGKNHESFNPSFKLAKAFSKIPYESIEQEVERVVKIANQNNIFLPWDDAFELVIKPDGKWNLVVIDLGEARLQRNEHVFETEDSNTEYSNDFLKRIKWLQEHFQSRFK
jgi:hypothetical protein